jgi:hypothetical protein
VIKNSKGTKIDIKEAKDGITYSKLVFLLENWAAQNNLIVLEVIVNSVPLDKNDEATLSKKTYSLKDEVLIKTQSPDAAALSAVREAKKQIPAFEKLVDEIIDSHQKGEKEEGSSKFSRLLNSIGDIVQLFKVLENYIPDKFEKILIRGKTILDINKEFLDSLQETKLAMEDQDFVTINDILEYEIKPKITEDYLNILEELEKIIPHP